jgi:uncharacterized membrane protein YcaP (DUF421 family)
METILRGIFVYLFVLAVFRMGGKRTLAEMTTFDLALLLIISETTQEAMLGGDHSVTAFVLLILTLVGLDIALQLLSMRWPILTRIVDDLPLLIVEHGRPLYDRMKRVRVDETEILLAARVSQGLERLEQIKYAVLERSGQISVIPNDSSGRG